MNPYARIFLGCFSFVALCALLGSMVNIVCTELNRGAIPEKGCLWIYTIYVHGLWLCPSLLVFFESVRTDKTPERILEFFQKRGPTNRIRLQHGRLTVAAFVMIFNAFPLAAVLFGYTQYNGTDLVQSLENLVEISCPPNIYSFLGWYCFSILFYCLLHLGFSYLWYYEYQLSVPDQHLFLITKRWSLRIKQQDCGKLVGVEVVASSDKSVKQFYDPETKSQWLILATDTGLRLPLATNEFCYWPRVSAGELLKIKKTVMQNVFAAPQHEAT